VSDQEQLRRLPHSEAAEWLQDQVQRIYKQRRSQYGFKTNGYNTHPPDTINVLFDIFIGSRLETMMRDARPGGTMNANDVE
jgi:hypothetical protein